MAEPDRSERLVQEPQVIVVEEAPDQQDDDTWDDHRHHEHVHGCNTTSMIVKKGLPALRWRPSSLRHVFCYRGLADIDAELEQLTMDPRRTPKGFARLISRMSWRTSADALGRPPLGRDFQRQ